MVIHISKNSKETNVTPPENMRVFLTGKVISYDNKYLFFYYNDIKSMGIYKVKIREFMNLPITIIPPLLNYDGSANRYGIQCFTNRFSLISFMGTYQHNELVNISNFGLSNML